MAEEDTLYTARFKAAVRAYHAWDSRIPAHPERPALHAAMIASIEALNCDEFALYQEYRVALLEHTRGVSKPKHKVILDSAGVKISWS